MTKKKKEKFSVDSIDTIGLLLALVYTQSVLTVAHQTSMWIHDGSTYTVGPPAVPALVVGLLLTGYSLRKNKLAITRLNIITLTIFATASLFWLSALRTNFYF